jgi:hypothetical protein
MKEEPWQNKTKGQGDQRDEQNGRGLAPTQPGDALVRICARDGDDSASGLEGLLGRPYA